MGYQVTARRWRPQTFDDLVEQQHVTRTLKNAIQLGRVAHAYLFSGTRGVGKTTMARLLAKALNCEQGPTVQPCNTCQSCREITQGSYLDIIEVDGASNRGIDEIRDLREQLRYLPAGGRYKIYIIDEVHMLTKEAFNALLKTLEEPPPHVVFVFATTELEKIPSTIVSRCQRFEFKRVSLAGIRGQLAAIAQSEDITISPASLAHIAHAAEGSMRDAQGLLDQIVAFCGTEIQDDDVRQLLGHVGSEPLVTCLDALFKQDVETALRTVGELQMEGYETSGILKALLEGLRHLIVLKTVPRPESLIPLSESDVAALHRVADAVSTEEVYGQFHILSAAESSLRYAGNPMLILEMALVRMACIGRVQPLQSVLDYLQQYGDDPASAAPMMPCPAVAPEPAAKTVQAAAAEATAADVQETSPLSEGDPWRRLQARVAQKRPSLAGCLELGTVVSNRDNKLTVGIHERDGFRLSRLREAENLAAIREIAQELFGPGFQVVIESLPDEAPAPAAAPALGADATDSDEPTLEDAEQSKLAFTQLVVDIFQAQPQ
jgi:DNA polymerase-3 subunit gamma/tau